MGSVTNKNFSFSPLTRIKKLLSHLYRRKLGPIKRKMYQNAYFSPPPLSFFVQVRSAQQHIGGLIQEFGDTGNGLINEMLPRPFLPSVTMEI